MSDVKIGRIDPSNLRDNAYQALRDAFTRGAFAPGDVLSLRDLADQLGVSMTPVREAVRRLVAEGALEDTPNRKLIVPRFDAKRMHDLKSARLALETLVLDQAIDRMTPETMSRLHALLAAPSQHQDGAPDLMQNYDFHFTLYRQSGSEVLLPLVEALWLQYGAYLNLIIQQQEARMMREHRHHDEILAAIEAGDKAAAQAALRRDVERSFNLLQGTDAVAMKDKT